MPIVSDVTQADVVVVGGGITGLATAYEVQKAGRSVVVLEASDYVGGRIMTRERNGDIVEVGQQYFLSTYSQASKLLDEIGHESATHISTLLIPRPLTFAIAGAAAGWFMRRLGMRNIAAIGSMLVVVSLMMIAAVTDELNTWVVVGAIALSGLGMGMVQPAIAASVANSVDDRDLGVAGAAQQMSVQVATSLGMNLLDTVQAGLVATSGLAASYASSYHLGALLTLGGVVAAWFVPKGTA